MHGIKAVAVAALMVLTVGCPKPKPAADGGTDSGFKTDAGNDAGTDAGTDSGTAPIACGWLQWGQNAAHGGTQCNPGQPMMQTTARFLYDPFVDEEIAEHGELLVHYPAPLLSGEDVYMMFKSGNYVPCDPAGKGTLSDGGFDCGDGAWEHQVWTYKGLRWVNGVLTEQWTFWSDWTPTPAAVVSPWQPVFQAALAGDFIYVPGKGGTVYKLTRADGVKVAQLNPFGAVVDPTWYVSGGLTTTAAGELIYNVSKFVPNDPFFGETQSFLVKVRADGTLSKVDYAVLVADAPAATDLCLRTFAKANPKPWPPSPSAQPLTVACGAQRPGVNLSPAVGADGTIFTASHAHRQQNYSYLIAVNGDLTPRWHTSLRGLLNDGCGVVVPRDADQNGYLMDSGVTSTQFFSHCRYDATLGVDPSTNQLPAGQVNDSSSSSPVALPDGTVVYGALTAYNNSRGHLMKFSAAGAYLASFDFGWDVTPAFFEHDGSYSLIIKDNHYGYYHGLAPKPPEYFITRLAPDLTPEWKFRSTNQDSCVRNDAGTPDCEIGTNVNGFEWCINAPAVDSAGVVYANSEDGWLYAINPDGGLNARQFLESALGAAYTPLSLDDTGRIYTLNKGTMSVVGR